MRPKPGKEIKHEVKHIPNMKPSATEKYNCFKHFHHRRHHRRHHDVITLACFSRYKIYIPNLKSLKHSDRSEVFSIHLENYLQGKHNTLFYIKVQTHF